VVPPAGLLLRFNVPVVHSGLLLDAEVVNTAGSVIVTGKSGLLWQPLSSITCTVSVCADNPLIVVVTP
jgi:hypothetical protein